jgi:hypothetical protein
VQSKGTPSPGTASAAPSALGAARTEAAAEPNVTIPASAAAAQIRQADLLCSREAVGRLGL